MTIQPTTPEQSQTKPEAQSVIARLQRALAWLKGVTKAYRGWIIAIAGLAFVVGVAVSINSLALTWSDIAPGYILLSAFVIVPIALSYGALNFIILARGAGQSVPFARALKVSCVASFAEFLPIPGGAMVRGGAMMQQGSGATDAAAHVMINALLWVACAAIAAAAAIGLDNPASWPIGLAGLTGVILCTLWLWNKAGAAIALLAIVMRVIGLAIAGARILAAFLAIGIAASFFEIYPFVFAAILGSAASIAPGGLGISEILAATIATLSTISSQAAFIAVALNRVIGLVISGVITAIIVVFGGLNSEKVEGAAP